MGIDKVGIDKVGIDEVGRYHASVGLAQTRPNKNTERAEVQVPRPLVGKLRSCLYSVTGND